MKRVLHISIPPGTKPAYLRFADGIRLSIQKGLLQPGERLPSARDLGRIVGLHRHTVMSALEELIAEGWITSYQRKGYYVSQTLPNRFFEPEKFSNPAPASKEHHWKLVKAPSLPNFFHPDFSLEHNFKYGIPDLREFPFQEFKSHLSDSLRASRPKILNYGSPLGHEPLIAELKIYMRRVRALNAQHVIVTHGSQEAIFLVSEILLHPGGKVAVEELGYQPAFATFKAAKAQLIPVKVDQDGLDPDALEKAAQRHKLTLIYLTPLHQYPTTVTLNISRRLRIYEIAMKYGIAILEDDYDHEFHYRSQPLAPIASHDAAGLVIYVSTLSKVFSPSARIGFMSLPKQLIGPIANYRRLVTRQNDLLMQDAVSRWMKAGAFERFLRRMRRLYEARRDVLVRCLHEAHEDGIELTFQTPDGGMAVWVDTHQNSADIAKEAARRGVEVGHEEEFRVRHRPGTYLRLCFASQSPAEIRKGMMGLIDAIKFCKR